MQKNILIGICGGIAAYKTCELVRILVKEGAKVKVVMTRSATEFIQPLVFQTLSANQVFVDMFEIRNYEIEHISLAKWADLMVIAPLSANTLGKIANGICDNLLTTAVCALPEEIKVICAPAMNDNMWTNPLVQENRKKLISLPKYVVMAPGEGDLACGVYGTGRMPEVADIHKKITETLS